MGVHSFHGCWNRTFFCMAKSSYDYEKRKIAEKVSCIKCSSVIEKWIIICICIPETCHDTTYRSIPAEAFPESTYEYTSIPAPHRVSEIAPCYDRRKHTGRFFPHSRYSPVRLLLWRYHMDQCPRSALHLAAVQRPGLQQGVPLKRNQGCYISHWLSLVNITHPRHGCKVT